ncbi:MAG: SEC-C metal-binding domain-containing protein [Myxococcota bacterium]
MTDDKRPAPGPIGQVDAPGCGDPTCCTPQKPVVRASPKVGRNDPCPCGSGRKHKKCCG